MPKHRKNTPKRRPKRLTLAEKILLLTALIDLTVAILHLIR